MGLTVNNLATLSLLNILNRTSAAQDNVLLRMATGSRINRAADDPAGLVAVASLDAELTSVNAGISNNQRTDALLDVLDGALSRISSLLSDIQSLAIASASDASLTADELAANQAQIDDALKAINLIVTNTKFNGIRLLDGSLAIDSSLSGTAGSITDIRVFSRTPSSQSTTLVVKLETAASGAVATSVMTTSASEDTTFTVQGKLGTAVITALSTENLSSVAYKINQATAQTGVSAVVSGTVLNLYSTDEGSAAFVRTRLVEGSGVNEVSDYGSDAVVTVNGQNTAVDGNRVTYSSNGISLSFELGTLSEGGKVGLIVQGDAGGRSGATFQLGTSSATRATLGIDSVHTSLLGNASGGYLATLASGGANSLINNPTQAAAIARAAATQVNTLRGRIGAFQRYQVSSALDSLSSIQEALTEAKTVINDVDYAEESAALSRYNILLQSAVSLLSMINQQRSTVLSLLE